MLRQIYKTRFASLKVISKAATLEMTITAIKPIQSIRLVKTKPTTVEGHLTHCEIWRDGEIKVIGRVPTGAFGGVRGFSNCYCGWLTFTAGRLDIFRNQEKTAGYVSQG